MGRLTGCLNAEVHLCVGGVGDGVAAELDGGTVRHVSIHSAQAQEIAPS